MSPAWVVFVTVPNRRLGNRLARALVREKLAACVNMIPGLISRYWWQGRISEDRELLLLIKTTPARYKSLEKRIRQLHSYSVPEILAIPVVAGNPAYLHWVATSIKIPSPAAGGRPSVR